MFRNILPVNYNFFDYFENHIAGTIKMTEEFVRLTNDIELTSESGNKIIMMEKELDNITHECIDALNKTFLTPIERIDIHDLIKKLDSIANFITAATSRLSIYEIGKIRAEMKTLAEILNQAAMELENAIKGLRTMKDTKKIKDHCSAVHTLENQGDAILQTAIHRLFKDNDAIKIIKWKEIFERVEKAIDKCNDCANIIEAIVITS